MKKLTLEMNEPDAESTSTNNVLVSSRNKCPTGKKDASLLFYIYALFLKFMSDTNIKILVRIKSLMNY